MLHIEADRQTHLWHEDEWHTSTFPSSAPYGGLRCKEEPSSPRCSVMIMKITCKNLCDVTLLKAGSSATCWEFEETWGREKKGRSRWNKLYCRRSSFLTRKSASKGGALSADVLETRGVYSQTTTHTHTHKNRIIFLSTPHRPYRPYYSWTSAEWLANKRGPWKEEWDDATEADTLFSLDEPMLHWVWSWWFSCNYVKGFLFCRDSNESAVSLSPTACRETEKIY